MTPYALSNNKNSIDKDNKDNKGLTVSLEKSSKDLLKWFDDNLINLM